MLQNKCRSSMTLVMLYSRVLNTGRLEQNTKHMVYEQEASVAMLTETQLNVTRPLDEAKVPFICTGFHAEVMLFMEADN